MKVTGDLERSQTPEHKYSCGFLMEERTQDPERHKRQSCEQRWESILLFCFKPLGHDLKLYLRLPAGVR